MACFQFLLSFLLAALASAAAVPSPVPTCYNQFLQALSRSPKQATSFCGAFTKTENHNTYPEFVFDYCAVETWEDTKLDRILSTVCSTYIRATSTPKPISATSTKKSSIPPAKATSSAKSSSKKSSTFVQSLSKKSSSSLKSSSRTGSIKPTTVKAVSISIKTSSKTSAKATSSAKSSSKILSKSSSTVKSSLKSSSSTKSSVKTSSTVKTSSKTSAKHPGSVKSSSKVSSLTKQTSSSLVKSSPIKSSSTSFSKRTSSSTKPTTSVESTLIPSPTLISTKKTSATSSFSSKASLSVSSKRSSVSASVTSASNVVLAAAPTATLVPVVHYATDISDVSNLIPQNSSALYYAEESYLSNPYLKHMYLQMQVNFTYATVIAEHSSHLKNFSCWKIDPKFPLYTQLTWELDSEEAYNVIHDTWLKLPNIVFVTNGDGCSQTSNNTRSYWLGQVLHVQKYEGDNTQWGYGSVEFLGDEILTTEGITDGDLVWGTKHAATNLTTNTPGINSSSPLCAQDSDPDHPTLAHVNPCTANFDQALDQQNGYVYTISSDRDAALRSTENLAAGFPNLVRIEHEVAEAIQSQGDSWFSAVAGDLEDFIESAASNIVAFVDSFIPSLPNGHMSIDMAPGPLVKSPWGDAFQIFSTKDDKEKRDSALEGRSGTKAEPDPEGGLSGELSVYCVKCGVSGEIDFHGSASFSLTDGVTALNFGMDGSMEAGINLGLDAEAKYTFPAWETNLATPQGVPILEVEGIIIVGPIIELKAELEFEVAAKGKVLTGASLKLPRFSANLDLVHTEYTTTSGFSDIEFNKYFTAEGEISASATLSLPYSIGVGIELIPLKWDKQVKIVEKPGFKAEIAYKTDYTAGSIAGTPADSSDDDDKNDCEGGITWDLKLVNEVDLNFFDLYKSKIADYESPPILEGCFHLGSAGNSSAGGYSNSGTSATNESVVIKGTSMIDSTGKFTTYAAGDGNVYLRSVLLGQTTYWKSETDTGDEGMQNSDKRTLVADDKSRDLYLFYDEMSAYGLSRVRALYPNEVPMWADRMVFGFGDIDDDAETPDQYFIASGSMNDKPYIPVACTVVDYQGNNATKIFAVTNEVEAGMKSLTENAHLASTITGGTVSGCIYLLFRTWNVQS